MVFSRFILDRIYMLHKESFDSPHIISQESFFEQLPSSEAIQIVKGNPAGNPFLGLEVLLII